MSNEQSIRDELATLLNDTDPEGGIDPDDEFADHQFWYPQVDAILASPVIRRIQAEALRAEADRKSPVYLEREDGTKEFLNDLRVHTGYAPRLMREQADRIERGETA